MKIKEAYCSYELSKLLKEKGFDEETNWYYNINGECELFTAWVDAYRKDYCPMPTHQMACAWLREEHDICICVIPIGLDGNHWWSIGIRKITPNGVVYETEKTIVANEKSTYDDATEVGLKYALENLI